jgi:hypothetical protein
MDLIAVTSLLTYILSPSVRPYPLALADRDRRAKLELRDLTAWFFGYPLPACQHSIGEHVGEAS